MELYSSQFINENCNLMMGENLKDSSHQYRQQVVKCEINKILKETKDFNQVAMRLYVKWMPRSPLNYDVLIMNPKLVKLQELEHVFMIQ